MKKFILFLILMLTIQEVFSGDIYYYTVAKVDINQIFYNPKIVKSVVFTSFSSGITIIGIEEVIVNNSEHISSFSFIDSFIKGFEPQAVYLGNKIPVSYLNNLFKDPKVHIHLNPDVSLKLEILRNKVSKFPYKNKEQ